MLRKKFHQLSEHDLSVVHPWDLLPQERERIPEDLNEFKSVTAKNFYILCDNNWLFALAGSSTGQHWD
jgi:hypothetical protein